VVTGGIQSSTRSHHEQGEAMAKIVEYVLTEDGTPDTPALFLCDDTSHEAVPENQRWSHAKKMHGTQNYRVSYPYEADQKG
jgi:hypothetical protein